MSEKIRRLTSEDYELYAAMDTGIEDDYINLFFERFAGGTNRLYGLFADGKLASMGGYSIFAGRYAMLGRLRSDRRFQRKSFATELMTHVKNEAFSAEGVRWVGGNTEEGNLPARRVLEKIGCKPKLTQYAATAKEVAAIESGEEVWQEIHSTGRKKYWLEKAYLSKSKVFPYQCYYPFPASAALFTENTIKDWTFYENKAGDRFFLTKHDQKRTHYLHVAYPWNDAWDQKGFWQTVSKAKQNLENELGEEAHIWMDIPKEEITGLPANHPFKLNSVWVLYEAEK